MVSAEVRAIAQCRIRKANLRAVVLVYIDDFSMFATTQEEAQQALDILLVTLKELGLAVSSGKTVAPTQRAVILGVEVDTVRQTVGVKPDHVRFTGLALDDILSSGKRVLWNARVDVRAHSRRQGSLTSLFSFPLKTEMCSERKGCTRP
jgi:hypothetical protein